MGFLAVLTFWVCSCVRKKYIKVAVSGEYVVLNSVLASLDPRNFFPALKFWVLQSCEKKTKSAFSQTRYTDSVLASLEPRLFHSKLFLTKKQMLLLITS